MNPPERHWVKISHGITVKDAGSQLSVWANSMNRSIGQINGITKMLYDIVPKDYGLVRAQDNLFYGIESAFNRFFRDLDALKEKKQQIQQQQGCLTTAARSRLPYRT
jgi:hypothetical protein